METLFRVTKGAHLQSLFVATFFLALHIFSVIFINSSFLLRFGTTEIVGLLYIAGAFSAIAALIAAPHLLRALGVFSLTIILSTIEIFTILAFGSAETLQTAALLFIAYWMTTILLLYCLDIFIEESTTEERQTSIIRGGLLTIANAALFVFPIIGGVILSESGYFSAYTIGALALVPFVIIILLSFRKFTDPLYPHVSLSKAFSRLREQGALQTIFLLHLMLRIFFSATVVYLPLYLLQVGFDWPEVGIILSLMLVPLVLFEFPVGEWMQGNDERTFFAVGFLILAAGCAGLAFLTGSNIALWGLVLFIAHSGAAIIEVVSESAFFKRVGSDDADLISLFRMLRPLGYIVGPGIATTLIPLIGYSGFFGTIAFMLFCGVIASLERKEI